MPRADVASRDHLLTTEELLGQVATYRGQLREHLESYARARPVRRVAVIGNAPLEASADRAAAIDECDLVVRVNSFVLDAPDGPPLVGRHCHVAVLARGTRPTVDTFRDYHRRAYLMVAAGLMLKPGPIGSGVPRHWPRDLGVWPISNRGLGGPLRVALAPERLGLRVTPTSGTVAVHLAHEVFPDAELRVAGMSFLVDPGQTHWDYLDPTLARSPVHAAHKLDAESALLLRWRDEGSLQVLP